MSYTTSSVGKDVVLVLRTSLHPPSHSWRNIFASVPPSTFPWSKPSQCIHLTGNSHSSTFAEGVFLMLLPSHHKCSNAPNHDTQPQHINNRKQYSHNGFAVWSMLAVLQTWALVKLHLCISQSSRCPPAFHQSSITEDVCDHIYVKSRWTLFLNLFIEQCVVSGLRSALPAVLIISTSSNFCFANMFVPGFHKPCKVNSSHIAPCVLEVSSSCSTSMTFSDWCWTWLFLHLGSCVSLTWPTASRWRLRDRAAEGLEWGDARAED